MFVTGHSGFTGSWLTLKLVELGAKVQGYSIGLPTEPSLFNRAEIGKICDSIWGDVLDREKLLDCVRRFQPDVVIHLAAQPLVRVAYLEPVSTILTNAIGTLNLLEAARKLDGLECALNVTTDKVYRNLESGQPFLESDMLGGHEPYSASKACSEIISDAYRECYLKGIVISARAGNIIGGGDWSLDRLVPDSVRAALANEPIRIRSPLSVRPWQHVADVVTGYLDYVRYKVSGFTAETCLNFGPDLDGCWTVEKVVSEFCNEWGEGASYVVASDANQTSSESKLLYLDASRAKRQLSWRPRLSPQQALKACVGWYKAEASGASPAELVQLMKATFELTENGTKSV